MSKEKDEFIATARKRRAQAADEESAIRKDALIDLRMVSGDQWEPKQRKDREDAGRPALTFNRLQMFTQQVSNSARQNRTEVKLNPVDDSSDPDTADVYEGLARHIQYSSDAKVAYENAVEASAGGSFGYFRLLPDYCSDESDEQELKVLPVYDAFSVYGVMMPTIFGRRCDWAFVDSTMTRDEFKAKWPDSEAVSTNFEGDNWGDWLQEDHIRVCEYWYVEFERVKISTGRTVVKRKVKFCTMNGVEVLPDTETDWPGEDIPIFAVLGRQMIVDGIAQVFSVIRFALDAQRLINYYKSTIAELLSIVPKSPYIGALGQFKTKQAQWASANRVNYAYLEYDPVGVGDKYAPPPQRTVYEAAIQAFSQAAAQEIDDMKASTGIYDSSLGARSNETSRVAILQRERQGDVANFHILDNLARAHDRLGRMIAATIRFFYDTARQVQILGADQAQKVVKVNQQFKDKKGNLKIHQLDVGKYDVTVTTDKAFATKRSEAFETLTQMSQGNPQIMAIGGDIIWKNSDIPGHDELAKRWKKTLPPALTADDDGDAIPPQAQQQIAQQGQLIEQLTQEVQTMAREIETKRFELESRERITAMQETTKRELGLASMDSKEGLAVLAHDLQILREEVARNHEAGMAAGQQEHETGQAAAAQEHATGLQDSSQQHQADQATQAQQATAEQQQAAAEQAAQLPKAA